MRGSRRITRAIISATAPVARAHCSAQWRRKTGRAVSAEGARIARGGPPACSTSGGARKSLLVVAAVVRDATVLQQYVARGPKPRHRIRQREDQGPPLGDGAEQLSDLCAGRRI